MPIQYKTFTLPIKNAEQAEADLNRFLRSVRVVHVHREFVNHGEHSCWCMAVEYLPDNGKTDHAKQERSGKTRVDYREVLSPEDFSIFAKLREWRKQAANAEAVPVYTIFTNEQLAKISEKKITTKPGLKAVNGVGNARVDKYGKAVIQIVASEIETQKQMNET